MQKWEYQFLTADGAAGEWRVRYVNGQWLQNGKKGTALYDFCNQMGEQGWEMVTLSHSPVFSQFGDVKRENFRIVMKRPKP